MGRIVAVTPAQSIIYCRVEAAIGHFVIAIYVTLVTYAARAYCFKSCQRCEYVAYTSLGVAAAAVARIQLIDPGGAH